MRSRPAGLSVLLVRLQADQDAARFGHAGRFLQGIAHEHMVLLLGGPGGLGAFVGVDDRRAAFGGKADGLLEIFNADLGLDKRACGPKGRRA